jgi:hypothetical protein
LDFSKSQSEFLHNVCMGLTQNTPKLVEWIEPPSMSPGAPCPAVHSDGHNLICAYYLHSHAEAGRSVALLKFDVVLQYRIGYPNEEALLGHPLYQFGLRPYRFYTVENSPLIDEIEKQNSCHSQHRPGIYAKFRHWIVMFHDETLEVLALRGNVSGQTELPPKKAVCQEHKI